MADKALRLKMERGQCMDLFPVPASAVAQALAPFGLEERDALSDLLPEGTFYSPLGPSDVQSGDQGDAASYTLGKKLKKSQYVARAPGLLRMLFQPWFSQEALDRLAAGRWRCENGILAPAELGEVRLPLPRPQARLDRGGLVHRMVWEADQNLTLEVFLPRELALAPGRELEMAGAVLTVEGQMDVPPAAGERWLLLSAGIPARPEELPSEDGAGSWRLCLAEGGPALKPGSWLRWPGVLPTDFWVGRPPYLFRL